MSTSARNRLAVAKAVSDAATTATDPRHQEAAEMTAAVARQAIKDMGKALRVSE